MNPEVILTADNTLMSDYRHNEFLGFGTCAPPNFVPDFLYRWLFFPPIKTKKGLPEAAPYGLRKIEAQLLKEGFNVLTVAPNHLGKYVGQAKVLGVHVMDPFGLGPASSTFAFVLKKDPYLAQYFHALMDDPDVKKAEKNGLKIIVGGPGAWQFHYRQGFMKKHGIDCVISGEAEKVIGKIVRATISNEKLPRFYEASPSETPSLDDIPDIQGPSVNGLVEIGRGCCRGCKFCSVTLRPLRWFPYDKITREMDVNLKDGNMTNVCLHAEDVMLYGSRNTLSNEGKLIELHELAVKKCENVCWSHCSLAAVASQPRLFSKIAEIIRQRQSWWGVQLGIETGSPELIKKVMPAKAHPFKPEEWPEVVRSSMGLMHDNGLVPAATLVVGAPDETEDDVAKTIELVDELKGMRSLIVPLFFVPVGKLKDEKWFKDAEMTELHRELLIRCMNHDFYWIDKLIGSAFVGRWYANLLQSFYRVFVGLAKRRAKKAGIESKTTITRLK